VSETESKPLLLLETELSLLNVSMSTDLREAHESAANSCRRVVSHLEVPDHPRLSGRVQSTVSSEVRADQISTITNKKISCMVYIPL
jgi:hypothetical protein